MSEEKRLNIKAFKITNYDQLNNLEKEYRREEEYELCPLASNTSFQELAEVVMPDENIVEKPDGSELMHPLYMFITKHKTTISAKELGKLAMKFLESEECEFEILSVATLFRENRIVLRVLIRAHERTIPDMKKLFQLTGDDLVERTAEEEKTTGNFVIPDEIKNFHYTPDEISDHKIKLERQKKVLESATEDTPFLNAIDEYVPSKLPMPEDDIPLIYDLETKEKQLKTVTPYETFNRIYRELITYVSGVEYYHYVSVMEGKEPEQTFMDFMEEYVTRTYITGNGLGQESYKLEREDIHVMLKKLYKAFFQLYIIQDLIDDKNVTDIKITAPDSIRVRVKGKAYLTNVHFVDDSDYQRFINALAIRNNVSLNVPRRIFTDRRDENYILRFSFFAEYSNSDPYPYLHIRKNPKKKMMDKELFEAGMFDTKLRDYLLDCGKFSRGVVFAGPPGSGKTILLNWFLERAYEQSAEILVIQESDELFAYRKGVMIQHVVLYPEKGKPAVSLEDLGKIALVAGANVFIIGETKGPEICSAITLANSGCRTALSIHSESAKDTPEKMVDLAMRGYAQNEVQARRMLKAFQTIVYLEDFKVKEIEEITGFNEKTEKLEFRCIYRREVNE